jgi:aprataxin
MSRKRPLPSSPPHHKSNFKRSGASRDGLGVYISNPAAYPASRVIYHNPSFVAIHDLYPKSSVHTLLLPRSPTHNLLQPVEAFSDAAFLASVRLEAAKLKSIVAKELQRRYGPSSKLDEEREAVLNGEIDADELPKGRDWEKEVLVGVHSGPSMNHLHVHVLSVDRHSQCLRHRKHYNSFATEFFVRLEEFPISREEMSTRKTMLKDDMRCWRCGENFGGRFKELKEHLGEEFEVWRRE